MTYHHFKGDFSYRINGLTAVRFETYSDVTRAAALQTPYDSTPQIKISAPPVVTFPSQNIQKSDNISSAPLLVGLAPIERVSLLFKIDKLNLLLVAAAGALGVYFLLNSFLGIASMFISFAHANDAVDRLLANDKNLLSALIQLFLGLMCVSMVIAWLISRSETKIKFAQEMIRILISFFVGFLTGGVKTS